MRVIAGQFRSRLISPPKGANIRPTSDRVKESLFAILSRFVEGKKALDLFSGSGSLGIEALSRGAQSVVFVDNRTQCVSAITDNLYVLGINNSKVVLKGAFLFIKSAFKAEISFDVIFADPPYYKDLAKKTLKLLDNYNIITSSGLVIIEHHKRDTLPDGLTNLGLFRQAKYGETLLSFFKKRQ
ncbi:MAG: 16S rRNA (guanine(966)-N(2))-methyltransferase RsmD [Candidatus Omnitrophota bacterium]